VHGIPSFVRFDEILGVPGFFDFFDDLREFVVAFSGEESVGQVTRDCEMDTSTCHGTFPSRSGELGFGNSRPAVSVSLSP
jgi:hypothetical protein